MRPAAVLAAAMTALPGCVLADPTSTLPVVAELPPHIIGPSVVPPRDQVLTTWPTQFIVPVTVIDPSKAIYWLAFEDYSPVNATPLELGPIGPARVADGGDVVNLVIRGELSKPMGPGCHTVRIVVAYAFSSGNSPDSQGGDDVSWLFSGSGDVAGCEGYDAGALRDGSFPDSGRAGGG